MNLQKLENVCRYIQRNDKNGDMLEFFQELQRGEAAIKSVVECAYRILSEWYEDSEHGYMYGLTIDVRYANKKDMDMYNKLMIDLSEYL